METHVNEGVLENIVARYPRRESSLIQVLQDVQREYNYLPREAVEFVAGGLGVPLAKVYGVATFYKSFSLEPQGRKLIHVCQGTACHIRGAGRIVDELDKLLGLHGGGTTRDLEYTVRTVNCVGACALAPVVLVDGEYHGNVQAADAARLVGLEMGGEGDEG